MSTVLLAQLVPIPDTPFFLAAAHVTQQQRRGSDFVPADRVGQLCERHVCVSFRRSQSIGHHLAFEHAGIRGRRRGKRGGRGTFNSREHLVAAMSNWPKAVGDHTVTDEWECADCGADFDCLSQFRQTDCA